jgi:hypothetical protein
MSHTLMFTGDINLMNVTDPTVPFARVGETLRRADVLFGNLECCLYDPGSQRSLSDEGFWAKPAAGKALKLAGYHALGNANNVNLPIYDRAYSAALEHGYRDAQFTESRIEVDPAAQQALAGDGSPMEEGARTRWLPLDQAIEAGVRGELADLKTELGLRRLRDHLARAAR